MVYMVIAPLRFTVDDIVDVHYDRVESARLIRLLTLSAKAIGQLSAGIENISLEPVQTLEIYHDKRLGSC